jgi:hypothetical protein
MNLERVFRAVFFVFFDAIAVAVGLGFVYLAYNQRVITAEFLTSIGIGIVIGRFLIHLFTKRPGDD